MHKYIIKIAIIILIISLIPNFTFCYYLDLPVWSDETIETVNLNNDSIDLKLESKAGILMDQDTGEILYDYNSHEKLRPASVTKIMSLLLIMEDLDAR